MIVMMKMTMIGGLGLVEFVCLLLSTAHSPIVV